MSGSDLSRQRVAGMLNDGLGVDDIKVRTGASYLTIAQHIRQAGRTYDGHLRIAVSRVDRQRRPAA